MSEEQDYISVTGDADVSFYLSGQVLGYHRQITLPTPDRNPFWQRVRALDKLQAALKALQKSGELSDDWQAFASQLEGMLSDEHVKELVDEPSSPQGQ